MQLSQAHREYYWNVHHHWIMYIPMIISFAIFGYGVYRKVMQWKALKPADERFKDVVKRAIFMIKDVLMQGRVRKKMLPGVFHSMIFWSFLILMMTTAILTIEIDTPLEFFTGHIYLVVSFLADIAGALLIVGLTIAVIRRYVMKPKSLESDWQNAYMLILLLFIGIGGFLLEGLRMKFAGDQWAIFSPVGLVVSKAMGIFPESSVAVVYPVIWWLHALATFALIATLPYTKFVHFILIPANYMFSNMEPKGSLKREDMEELFSREDLDEFRIGMSDASDLTWKNAMNFDACIECGRCEEICPVCQCGYPLNPRKVVKSLKKSLYEMYEKQEAAKAKGNGGAPAEGEAPVEAQPLELDPFIGATIDEHTLWLCRTCRACMEVCPAMVEHVDQVIDIRRSEVMMNGRLPADAKRSLKALETRGNPYGPQEDRLGWIEGEKPEIIPADGQTDVLFWMGCCTNYDQNKRHVAMNVFAILREAGVKFGMLGDEEFCCGDPARCLGDENVFQTIAKQQVEILNARKFNTLLVICPHCYNVLKNEYPQFGGKFNVVHHSDFILQLIKQGKIKLPKEVKEKVVYHDPCYLGRYAEVYDAPREVLKSVKGVQFVEAGNKREKSFCCGGGGGNYFMDLDLDVPGDERLNVRRVKEFAGTGADTIAVSCIYCMQMLDDGVKLNELDEKIKVKDISTLVVEAMGLKTEHEPAPAIAQEAQTEANVEK